MGLPLLTLMLAGCFHVKETTTESAQKNSPSPKETNITTIEKSNPTQQPDADTVRYSEERIVLWEDANLGLRVTAPEWIEYRYAIEKQNNGTWKYSEWRREYSQGMFYYGVRNAFGNITGHFGPLNWGFEILNEKYTNKSFEEVAHESLLSAGYCSTSWRETKSECINQAFCYTKDEVIKNLILRKTGKFGPYSAQLWGINKSFSDQMDCRGENTWLIQAKGGVHVILRPYIYFDRDIIRLEGF